MIALAMPFGIIMAVYEIRVSQVPSNQIAAKRHLLDGQKQSISVLVLGSSHSYYGILPATFSKPAFNLAAVSQTLYYDDALLRRVIETMPSLKLVVLPISYFSLETQLDEGVERWRGYFYQYEWGIPQHEWHMGWHIRNFSAYFLCGRELGHRNVLLGRIRDVTEDYDHLGGWTNRPATSDSIGNSTMSDYLSKAARLALKRHSSGMKQKNLQENEKILSELAQHLSSRGIGLVLVTFPVSKYYSDGMEASAYRRMQETLSRLSSSKGVSYFNYTFDSRFAELDFWDGDHLNTAGAVKFSKILNDEVVSPYFLKEDPTASKNGNSK